MANFDSATTDVHWWVQSFAPETLGFDIINIFIWVFFFIFPFVVLSTINGNNNGHDQKNLAKKFGHYFFFDKSLISQKNAKEFRDVGGTR